MRAFLSVSLFHDIHVLFRKYKILSICHLFLSLFLSFHKIYIRIIGKEDKICWIIQDEV